MSRIFINQLADGQGIDEIYLASEKQLRSNREEKLYLQVRLSDKTGSLTCMLWNANQSHFDSFQNGDYIRVKGKSQVYNGGMQVIAREFQQVAESTVSESDFITLSEAGVQKLVDQLRDTLSDIRNVHLRQLGLSFLDNSSFMSNFRKAPAGIKNHHAYHGGLIEHVVSVLELAVFLGDKYDRLDRDLLVMGAFLHDIGKINELRYQPDLGYRDDGQLIGHMVMGVELLQNQIDVIESATGETFPAPLITQLKHLILSHHGQLEYGSPVLPMTLEAVALTLIDNIDAKINSIAQVIDEDPNPNSNWTTYQPSLGRKLFKGLRSGD